MTAKALRYFVTEFRKGILDGGPSMLMCYVVCWPLQALLSVEGVETDLVKGTVGDQEHYWLKLPDGRIIDPTADQFPNLPSVYIGKQPTNYVECQ